MADESEAMEPDPETTCSVCYAEFLDPEDLTLHMEQVHATEQSTLCQCQFCSSAFSNSHDYAFHIRDAHLASMKCCKYCSRAFIDKEWLRKHENKHNDFLKKDKYRCSQCKYLFNNSLDLEQHEVQDHQDEIDGVMLHDHYALLSSILNIKAPMLLQSLGTNTVFICNKCQFTTPDIADYIQHLQTKNCQSLACDKCFNVYREKRGIIKHLYSHPECYNHAENVKKLCKTCHRHVNALTFQQHFQYCKPFKCNICDILFDSVHQLSEHQTTEHPLAISLTYCPFCRREFVGTVALDKHIKRTHGEDMHLYKYMCVYCESVYFKHPKALFAHFFSKHPSIQPYSCKICNKTFRIRKRFTIHIKLDHKSVGIVEFDERYHVYFTDKKSENAFQPTSLFPEYEVRKKSGVTKNSENIEQTDKETDAETSHKQDMSESERKHPKIRFKEQAKANSKLGNVNSDFMTVTETEGNQTENDAVPTLVKQKRKRKSKMTNDKPNKLLNKGESDIEYEALEFSDEESEDEPLVNLQKHTKPKRLCHVNKKNKIFKNKHYKDNRKHLTCKICNKYCYTYQNYQNHVSLHSKNEAKKCVKCSKEFLSKTALKKHMTTEHATSKLTETLKSLLERRKNGGLNANTPQLTNHEKFYRTIKKVKTDPVKDTATIKEAVEKMPVQKFLETFTPDSNDIKNQIKIQNAVTVRTLNNPIRKPPAIKMTRFQPKPVNYNGKLAMPVRFKQNTEKHHVTVKLVQTPVISRTYSLSTLQDDNQDNQMDDGNDYYEETVDYEEEADDKRYSVPEVAEEVMLEGTEEPKTCDTTVIPHKIVLPKLPKGCKNISIAHLLPEAPYFKIVKLGDKKKETETTSKEEQDVKLPSGTKLVNVNPLAHLLGGKPVEEIVGTPSKYYKPKKENFEKAIAKALLDLEKPPKKRKINPKKKSLEVEQ